MRAKILSFTLLAMLVTSLLCLNPIQASAQTCDYIDEDGYCVIIVDNSKTIPSIGEMTDEEYSDGRNEVYVFVDSTIKPNQIDEDNRFGQVDETKSKLIEEYRKEYQMIVKGSSAIIGEEELFIQARLSGLSYIDAYLKCFTYDREIAIEEITENVASHKDWFQTFFDTMNSESFIETVNHFGEVISNMFN